LLKRITHKDYKDCLFSGEEQTRTMNLIGSRHHDVYTVEVNKVAFSANDDKPMNLQDGLLTLAIGHYKVKKGQS